MDKCCICLVGCDNKITVSCCKVVLCETCLLEYVNKKNTQCPMFDCKERLNIKYKNFNPAIFLDQLQQTYVDYTVKQNELYNTIKMLLKLYNCLTYDIISHEIRKLYREINSSSQLLHVGLSTKQADEILKICEEKHVYYEMYNIIIAMCVMPWTVSPPPAGSNGLCYHGNFGDVPSFNTLINLIWSNHSYL